MLGKLLLGLATSTALLAAACAAGPTDSGPEARDSGVADAPSDAPPAPEGSIGTREDANPETDAGHPEGGHPKDGATHAVVDGATEAGCGDTKNDPENCGACAHACDPMEGCEGGTCNPILLNGPLGRASSMALDTTNLYFASVDDAGTGSFVQSTPLDGGPTTTLVTSSDGTLAGTLIVKGASVYGYSSDFDTKTGTIWTAGTTAPTTETVLASGFPSADYSLSLATDGTDVYYDIANDLLTKTPAGIARVPVTGGTAVLWNTADDYNEIVIAGATAYFSSGYLGGISSELLSAAPQSNEEATISVSSGSIFALGATDAYQAVELTSGRFEVQIVPLSGASHTVISPTYALIYALAFDDTAVYCAAYLGGTSVAIDRLSLTGEPLLRLFASDDNDLDQLLVDSQHLFIRSSGTILRIPK